MSLRARSARIAPVSNEQMPADAETTFTAPQPPRSPTSRQAPAKPARRPRETVQPPATRERTRGSLVVELDGRAPEPPSGVGMAFRKNGKDHGKSSLFKSSDAETGDNVQLISAMLLDSPGDAGTLRGPLALRGTLRGKEKTPKDLQARSLSAGRQALLVHFALLSRYSCKIVDLQVLDALLAGGGDINARDALGQGVLHEVARLWDATVASYLIEKGADFRKADNFGRQPIHVAAGEDATEVMELLLDRGVDINAVTERYIQTPVHHAAANDAVKTLTCLIKRGAEYEGRDFRGRTPLQLAVGLDRTEAVHYLLSLDLPAFAGVESTDGQKALTAMIVKMPEVAAKALEQFHSTSASQRTQLYWINYMENSALTEGELVDGGAVGVSGKALTPLEVIVEGRHYSLLTSPVVLRSLKLKWRYFGKRAALIQTFVYTVSLLVWSLVSVACDWEKRHLYPTGQKWRIAFEVAAVMFLVYDCSSEVVEYVKSQREHEQWAEWRLASLERDLATCHPACPDEADYVRQEIKRISDSSPSYFEDMWNVLDWLCYILMLASVISHVINIVQPSRTIARVHAAIMTTTVIFMWLRLLKYLRAFRKLGPFVVMVTRIVRDVFKFVFLYLIVFVPYACGFWTFFGNRDIETVPATNTTSATVVSGFADASELLFQLFMASIGNEDFISNIVKIDSVIARLLVGTFLGMTSILMLNLLIALMSDTFQRVHDNVAQNSLMQQATTVITVERKLSSATRQKFREFIAKTCSPERLYYDDDSGEQEDLNKIARQTFDEVLELKDMLSERLPDPEQEWHVQEEIAALRQEVRSLHARLDSLSPTRKTSAGSEAAHDVSPQRQLTGKQARQGRLQLPPLKKKIIR